MNSRCFRLGLLFWNAISCQKLGKPVAQGGEYDPVGDMCGCELALSSLWVCEYGYGNIDSYFKLTQ